MTSYRITRESLKNRDFGSKTTEKSAGKAEIDELVISKVLEKLLKESNKNQ